MAGTAFLPWEEWIARLLHPLYVAIRRWLYKVRRRRALTRAERWPQSEGTVERITWDSSLPREEIVYCYTTEQGYYSGSHWRWFDRLNARQVREGDRITVRDNPEQHENSVFSEFADTSNR
jgi:hypothetical protein